LVDEVITRLVEVINVLYSFDNVRNNQRLLTFSEGSESHFDSLSKKVFDDTEDCGQEHHNPKDDLVTLVFCVVLFYVNHAVKS
jgi:hypothetical protein